MKSIYDKHEFENLELSKNIFTKGLQISIDENCCWVHNPSVLKFSGKEDKIQFDIRQTSDYEYNISDKTRYSYYVQADLNAGVSGDQTFYLDDMTLVKVDIAARP